MEALPLPNAGDTWYRYKDAYYASLDAYGEASRTVGPFLEEETFRVVKVTFKGVWVQRFWGAGGLNGEKRFVLLAARRRYAHPSKEEALKSLAARKERQLSILMSQAERARKALSLAQGAIKAEASRNHNLLAAAA